MKSSVGRASCPPSRCAMRTLHFGEAELRRQVAFPSWSLGTRERACRIPLPMAGGGLGWGWQMISIDYPGLTEINLPLTPSHQGRGGDCLNFYKIFPGRNISRCRVGTARRYLMINWCVGRTLGKNVPKQESDNSSLMPSGPRSNRRPGGGRGRRRPRPGPGPLRSGVWRR